MDGEGERGREFWTGKGLLGWGSLKAMIGEKGESLFPGADKATLLEPSLSKVYWRFLFVSAVTLKSSGVM